MAAVWIRLRAELRSRRRAWLGLALVRRAAGGAVLATVAAARRTDSALTATGPPPDPRTSGSGRSDFFGARGSTSRASSGCRRSRDATRSIDLAFWGRTDSGAGR